MPDPASAPATVEKGRATCGSAPIPGGGCQSDEGTSEFAPAYVAVAYGTVAATGVPAAGVTIRAHGVSECVPA